MASITSSRSRLVDDIWGVPILSVRLSESFDEVVALNPELRMEQTASGEIVMMNPTGGEGGFRNARLTFQLQLWVEKHGGLAFDSSTLFCLPNGAKRSPDASWIATERWQSLSKEDRKRYPPICPDFVVELRSESDRLADLSAKMKEYVECGICLGWLIDPLLKQVHIYRPGQATEILDAPEHVAADSTLPGFVLDLRKIWDEI
jgi:Uma2 family endonuclease